MSDLEEELRALLNRRCQENESNTPDFVLAAFILSCLAAFNIATQARDRWYGIAPKPGEIIATVKGIEL